MSILRKRNKLIAAFLTLAIAASCFCIAPSAVAAQTDNVDIKAAASTGGDTFSWDNATVYFLLTDRFYNGDKTNDHSYGRGLDANGQPYNFTGGLARGTFHGGDFAGITDKIEEGYFDDLGVNAIWLSAPYEQIHGYVVGDNSSPSYPHYSYHGYYVLDYTESDKNFGTKEEFQKLVDTAHEHGIRIIMDIVMNHAGYNSLYDMNEYGGYGTIKGDWRSIYYNYGNISNATYHSVIDYETSSSDWGKWWGPGWIRAGLAGYTQGGGSDYTMSLQGLPDFKTESTASVGIPTFLQNKWKEEKTYEQKIAKYGSSGTVTDYLTKWLSEWVETYGVDGFRCDTAKHVELASWAKLKDACVQALRTWKSKNPTKKLDDLDFWMTGEVWDHGVGKDNYYTQGKFDSLINFDTTGGGVLQKGSVAGKYKDYAAAINSDDSFNVLSYMSSHDSTLARGDMYYLGSAFLMLPGAVQIYYGDETNRSLVSGVPFDGNGGSGHALRSDMNWDNYDAELLAHWDKVGTFRSNHIAIGAGSNLSLNASNGIGFGRTYSKNGIIDKAAGVIGASANSDVTIDVSSIWEDGKELVNAYDDSSATVENGKVKFNSGAHGTILIQEPDGKPLITLSGKENFTGTQTITLTIDGANEAKVSVDGANKIRVSNGGTFTIGDKAYEGSYVQVTAEATNEKGTSTKRATYYKCAQGESGPPIKEEKSIIHVKPKDSSSQLYVWIGDGDTKKEPLGAWSPGTYIMSGTNDGDGYYSFDLNTTEPYNFITHGSNGQSGNMEGNTGEIWVDVISDTECKILEKTAESGMDTLKKAATSCKVLTATEYTAETYSAITSALSSAESVIAKGGNASESEISSALAKINSAKAALKVKAPSITVLAAGGTTITGKTAPGSSVTVTVNSTEYKTTADDFTGVYTVSVPALKSTDSIKVNAVKAGVASVQTTRTVSQGPISDGDSYVVGDASLDGIINLYDALLTARHSIGYSLTGMALAAADANGDSKVELADALLIQKYASKMNVSSQIGTVKNYK